MKTVLLVVLSLVLASCTSMVWNKYGATRQDFDRDSYACERDTYMIPVPQQPYPNPNPYQGFADAGNYLSAVGAYSDAVDGMYERCMRSKGWALQPASPQVSATSSQDYRKWLAEHPPK